MGDNISFFITSCLAKEFFRSVRVLAHRKEGEVWGHPNVILRQFSYLSLLPCPSLIGWFHSRHPKSFAMIKRSLFWGMIMMFRCNRQFVRFSCSLNDGKADTSENRTQTHSERVTYIYIHIWNITDHDFKCESNPSLELVP